MVQMNFMRVVHSEHLVQIQNHCVLSIVVEFHMELTVICIITNVFIVLNIHSYCYIFVQTQRCLKAQEIKCVS